MFHVDRDECNIKQPGEKVLEVIEKTESGDKLHDVQVLEVKINMAKKFPLERT